MLSTISTPRLALSESHYWTVPAFSRREIKRRRHWPLGSAFVDTYRVKVLHPNHANSIRVFFLHQNKGLHYLAGADPESFQRGLLGENF